MVFIDVFFEITMTSRLARLLALHSAIKKGDFPDVERLCRMLEVKPRTLFNDLRELKEKLGLDVKFDRSRNGYYFATPDRKMPSFALTEDELVILALAAHFFGKHTGSAVAQVLESAILKIVEARSPNTEVNLGAATQFLRLTKDSQPSMRPNHFIEVYKAFSRDGKIEVLHTTNDATVVSPEFIHFDGQNWHLICRTEEEGNPLQFRLDEIKATKYIGGGNNAETSSPDDLVN